jgi:hypothetical protein
MIKVQVGLTPEVQAKLVSGGGPAVNRLAKRLGLSRVDACNLEMFGMLTADIDPAAATALADDAEVAFVEAVGEKRVLKG